MVLGMTRRKDPGISGSEARTLLRCLILPLGASQGEKEASGGGRHQGVPGSVWNPVWQGGAPTCYAGQRRIFLAAISSCS